MALAVAAHPDDIEFVMAGTLLQLARKGWEIHYLNLSSGNCGSTETSAARTRTIRLAEARTAASILGAVFHPPLTDDLEIIYELKLLRRLASVIRKIQPAVVLTHSPQDYMEDHTNTCRLTASAVFTRGMPNFQVHPKTAPTSTEVAIYHAMPHGLRDPLRRRIVPGAFVNTAPVQSKKLEALKAHRSQQGWLDASQGLNSYLQTMEEMAMEVGRLSKRFSRAEGWRRHLHLGFGSADFDPLSILGADYQVNQAYERALDQV